MLRYFNRFFVGISTHRWFGHRNIDHRNKSHRNIGMTPRLFTIECPTSCTWALLPDGNRPGGNVHCYCQELFYELCCQVANAIEGMSPDFVWSPLMSSADRCQPSRRVCALLYSRGLLWALLPGGKRPIGNEHCYSRELFYELCWQVAKVVSKKVKKRWMIIKVLLVAWPLSWVLFYCTKVTNVAGQEEIYQEKRERHGNGMIEISTISFMSSFVVRWQMWWARRR
jgi:hypothetical protein